MVSPFLLRPFEDFCAVKYTPILWRVTALSSGVMCKIHGESMLLCYPYADLLYERAAQHFGVLGATWVEIR